MMIRKHSQFSVMWFICRGTYLAMRVERDCVRGNFPQDQRPMKENRAKIQENRAIYHPAKTQEKTEVLVEIRIRAHPILSFFSSPSPPLQIFLSPKVCRTNINFSTLMHPLGGWVFVVDVTRWGCSVGKFISSAQCGNVVLRHQTFH